MIATLRQRNFALVWTAGLISLMGDWVLYIALPIYVYQLTGSPLATSIMFAAEAVPALLMGSVAGVFVDRWDRKRTMVVANLLLMVGLLPLLLVRSASDVWIVYIVSVFESLVAQFFYPAENAFLPTLVDERRLVSANSLNSLNNNLARLIGPAAGGFIASQFGLAGVVLVDAVSFLLAAALIAPVTASGKAQTSQLTEAAEAVGRAWRRVWSEWLQGLRLVRRERTIGVLLAMFGIASFGEGVMGVVFVIWVKEVLGGGPQELGWFMSAQAVGGLLGGFTIGALGARLAPVRLASISPIVFGLMDMALFLYPMVLAEVWPGLILIALVGLPAAALGAGWTTLVQRGVRDEYRGRVFGVLGTTQSLLRLVGLFTAGVLGGLVNPMLLLAAFQGGSYVVVGLIGLAAFSTASLRPSASSAPQAAPVEPVGTDYSP